VFVDERICQLCLLVDVSKGCQGDLTIPVDPNIRF
jgi:hypothetical protein